MTRLDDPVRGWWTLPLEVDSSGRVGRPASATVADRLRLVLDVVPGERPLVPDFGCRMHAMPSLETARERAVAATLVEEALARWAPWAGVRRVEVAAVAPEEVVLRLERREGEFAIAVRRRRSERAPEEGA